MAVSRSIFRFKKFQIAHGKPGLKISTEACLLGAWASRWAKGRMLDIGTGSGVLACMLAQKHPESSIDAIEIRQDVAELAAENVQASPFHTQISVQDSDLQSFSPNHSYDFIICNPPFFHQHLAAGQQDLQVAIHDDLLHVQDLTEGIHRLLNHTGEFAVLYPPHSMEKFENCCDTMGLFLNHKAYIFHDEDSPNLRIMAIGSRENKSKTQENIRIKQADGSYTETFEKLLSDYYLLFS